MSTITIKKMPEALHEAIKTAAEKNGRSLNKEIITRLEQTLQDGRFQSAEHLTNAQIVREQLGVYLTQDDLDIFKAQGRT
ncbi:MAG: Arc family DNA-binding protein [Kiritimatiellia bacterium]